MPSTGTPRLNSSLPMVGGGEGLALPLRIYLGGAGRYDEVMSLSLIHICQGWR